MWIERVGLRVVLVAVFIGAMLLLKEGIIAAMAATGWWIVVPFGAICLWIGWLWDRKDQRDRAG
jgi:1,4-dihydroxy-2-naphthoate octaprenyltransferase